MSEQERKPAENAIYFDQPVSVSGSEISNLDALYTSYESRKKKTEIGNRWRKDLDHCLNGVHAGHGWHIFGIAMSKGEASSIQSSVNHGDYGKMRCVYRESKNQNNAANPNQITHQLFAERLPNA